MTFTKATIISFLFTASIILAKDQQDNRSGKIFSLFNVIQFKNDPCISSSTLSTGQSTNRNGTCFSESECSNKGGSAKGGCASGFGVCCVFLYSSTSNTISYNDSYLQNPGFPSAFTSTGTTISYTITKCSNNICWLRLDFEQNTIEAPSVTTEASGGACVDSMTVTTNTGQVIPTICGANNGEHIYIDIGAANSDTATVAFTIGATSSTSRIWDIKVAQIPCGANYAPPDGCLQYQTGLTGRFTSFNWADSTTTQHLASQTQPLCIRQEEGYCCVQYQACSVTSGPAAGAAETSNCSEDYVMIEGAGTGCTTSQTSQANKLCGSIFAVTDAATINQVICDCSQPFIIDFVTDATSDDTDGTNAVISAGICLDYTQVKC